MTLNVQEIRIITKLTEAAVDFFTPGSVKKALADANAGLQITDQLQKSLDEANAVINKAAKIKSDQEREAQELEDWRDRLQSGQAQLDSDKESIAADRQKVEDDKVKLAADQKKLEDDQLQLSIDKQKLADGQKAVKRREDAVKIEEDRIEENAKAAEEALAKVKRK